MDTLDEEWDVYLEYNILIFIYLYERNMFQSEVVEKISTHFMPIYLDSKLHSSWDN
jgi:hypothetical protein